MSLVEDEKERIAMHVFLIREGREEPKWGTRFHNGQRWSVLYEQDRSERDS